MRPIHLVTTNLRDLYLYKNPIPIVRRSLTVPDIGMNIKVCRYIQ